MRTKLHIGTIVTKIVEKQLTHWYLNVSISIRNGSCRLQSIALLNNM
jgi:hypothetical protein